MYSIWEEGIELPFFDELEGDHSTEVLIIGGGLAGILCAYFLQESGVDYMLLEGDRICGKTTKNTTAKITFQHGLLYHKLLRKKGLEQTQMYLGANQAAVNKYFELCRNIDCDFEVKPSYVYSIDKAEKLEKEMRALEAVGYTPELSKTLELPFPTAGAVKFHEQAQFHPLKFAGSIAKNLNIYENSFVRELGDHWAVTDKGKVAYKKLIIATHFPIDNKHGLYFMKMYQHRSYVIALKNASNVRGMYVDEAKGGLSFRNQKDYLLIGGGGHRTGKRGGSWQELRSFGAKYYSGCTEDFSWAAQDCIPIDDVPYIGRYSKHMGDYFVATGFQKWGVSTSMAAAMILRDLVMEKQNEYAQLFSPSRNMLKPRLFMNLWESASNLLSFSKKRCPHLGCALKWNGAEHSWDCPCHGSRFDAQGHVLDNPANGNAQWK